MTGDVFTANSLSLSYGRNEVLHDISFSAAAGEFIALIGPNGAGKSTLLKAMAGILPAPPGSLLLNGMPLEKLSALDIARKLSLAPQFTGAAMPYTVKDFVSMGLFPYRKPFQFSASDGRTQEIISLCGLERLQKRPLAELSGGELQLALIAKAILQNSDLLLLDEPASHLDVKHIAMMMDILSTINKSGGTVIAALHDLNLAASWCGRLIALKEGKIFFDGTPRGVLRSELVSGLYDTNCVVSENPVTGTPFVWFMKK
ncbi:MAG: ABC transporter ATP-binding protein [Spirochaetia bacterium]|jgi:iron complex transport system ATP-binding protein|nr:ABC transporter ATP-binding protein [Spirochaetia bacterium]